MTDSLDSLKKSQTAARALHRLRELIGDLLDSVHVLGETTDRLDADSDAPASLPATGIFGALSARATPAGGTDSAVKTPLVRMLTASSTGGAWSGDSHPIGGFDILRLEGANGFAQVFGHEARIDNAATGTVADLTFYKAVLGTNAGPLLKATGLDFPDLSVLAPSAERKAILVRDPGATSELAGGYSTGGVSILTAARTLTPADSGKIIPVAAGAPCTITCPSTMPAGRVFDLIQADGNQMTVAAGAGAALVNASAHAKSRALGSVLRLVTTSTGVFILSGDTAA